MILKPQSYALLVGALLLSAGISSTQAASTFVTFSVDMSTNLLLGTFNPPPPLGTGTDTVEAHGTFNGYAALYLAQQGSSTIFTNTVNDTADANGSAMQYKFVINGSTWEPVPNGSGGNRYALLPSTSGASLVLPTAFFGDAGAPVVTSVDFQVDVAQQIALGNFITGTSSVEVRGTGVPNTWSGGNTLTLNPAITRTNQFGLVTTNVYTGTFNVTGSPGGFQEYKFVINNPGTQWDAPQAPNSDNGGNRYFANVAQTLPVANFNDAPYAPLCTNIFSVDMSGPAGLDASYDATSVRVAGSFNGWSADIAMTNNPAAANTNVFSTVMVIGAGTTIGFQYRYNNSGGTVYDHLNGATGGQGNRSLTVPTLANYTIPAVYFNDASYNDYLQGPVAVTFRVNMNGAVGTDSTPWTEGAYVYVNGPWPNWQGWDPLSLASQRLVEIGTSGIFTNTFMIPAAIVTSLTYKYSINGADNEAGQDSNHNRVIRSTITGAYNFSEDKFGSQYVEPSFGQLAVGKVSAGNVPLSWLGRPGCEIQTSSNLTSGAWLSLPLTDGTNWSVGTISTNGLVSSTNWPAASGNLFFRLIKQ